MDDAPEDTEPCTEDAVTETQEDDVIMTDHPAETPIDEPSDDATVKEDSTAEDVVDVPEADDSVESETEDEPVMEVRGNMLLAAEPTRGSAYLSGR